MECKKCEGCGRIFDEGFFPCPECNPESEAYKLKQCYKALILAYETMNYLGDILNNHDMIQPEDEAVTKEAFKVVPDTIEALKG